MSFLEKLRRVISEDEETKKLKVHDNDVILVYNYIQSKKQKNIFGSRLILKTKPFFHTVTVSTKQTRKIEFEKKLEQQHNWFNYDLNFDDISLENFKINESKKEILVKDFKKISNNFILNNKGFFLHGPFNTGKTYFLKIIAKELIKQQIPFIFVLMSDLVRQFKIISWHNEVLENKLNYLKKVPYLFLDDLGTEQMNPNFRDDILFSLLNYRLENKKPLFISSNMKLNDLVEHFKFQEFNSDVKANKIVVRIYKLTKSYSFKELFI
ncbi:ATP-binding protein [Candidatus Phytoplasma prunorum]|uniref:ATP-binding protein n=1 Tax=Candidatus Phytoplasma prunorum TaxID=47565 RepID=UPI002FF3A644